MPLGCRSRLRSEGFGKSLSEFKIDRKERMRSLTILALFFSVTLLTGCAEEASKEVPPKTVFKTWLHATVGGYKLELSDGNYTSLFPGRATEGNPNTFCSCLIRVEGDLNEGTIQMSHCRLTDTNDVEISSSTNACDFYENLSTYETQNEELWYCNSKGCYHYYSFNP